MVLNQIQNHFVHRVSRTSSWPERSGNFRCALVRGLNWGGKLVSRDEVVGVGSRRTNTLGESQGGPEIKKMRCDSQNLTLRVMRSGVSLPPEEAGLPA